MLTLTFVSHPISVTFPSPTARYDPDDSGDIVMTIHHVPRLVRSVIVMAILCCLCCCFAAVTAPFVD